MMYNNAQAHNHQYHQHPNIHLFLFYFYNKYESLKNWMLKVRIYGDQGQAYDPIEVQQW